MAGSREYRVLFFEGLCTVGVTRMRCASDAEAREWVATFPVINTIEIWNGKRKIYRSAAGNGRGSNVREQHSTESPGFASLEGNSARELVHTRWRAVGRGGGGIDDGFVKKSRAAIAESRELLQRPFRAS